MNAKHLGIRLLGWLAFVAGFAVAAAQLRILILGHITNGWMLLGEVPVAAFAAYLFYIGRRAVLIGKGQQPPKARFGYGRILLGVWLIFSSSNAHLHLFPTRQGIRPLEPSNPTQAVAMDETEIAIFIGCIVLIVSGIWNVLPSENTHPRGRNQTSALVRPDHRDSHVRSSVVWSLQTVLVTHRRKDPSLHSTG